MNRKKQIDYISHAACSPFEGFTEKERVQWTLGATWADEFPTDRQPPSLSEAKEIWSDAHAMWVSEAKFPDEPQASVAYYYAVATLRLLERRARK